jgi:dienelactone hydrolase
VRSDVRDKSLNALRQLIVYGHAMHGFTHEHAAAHPMPGVAYDATADARSWIAIQTFFDELFARPTSGL